MTFLSLSGLLGFAGSLWLYAGIGLLGSAHIFFTLPETRCISLESIAGQFSATPTAASRWCHQQRTGVGLEDESDD
jgi:hypothetical protein